MAKPSDIPTNASQKASMRLRVPWESEIIGRFSRGNHATQYCEILDKEGLDDFLYVRTGLHELYIRETERTRRFGMSLAASLLAVACLIPVFAPPGRETISYVIGVALFVFSAGSMGYTRIRLASEKRQMSVSKDADA